MKIQQAIFTSSDRSLVKGYQVVARSPGVDSQLAKQLHRWSPTQLISPDPQAWTINYFPVSGESVAVSRTVIGGPEYSGRGGSQIVTLIAVMQNAQFAAYHNHAINFVHTALAMGYLRLPREIPSRGLELLDMPDCPLVGSSQDQHSNATRNGKGAGPGERPNAISEAGPEHEILNGICQLAEGNRRLAVVGARNAIELVSRLLDLLPCQTRRRFSFTTGLPLSLDRPFQAHFFSNLTPGLEQSLASESIQPVSLSCESRERAGVPTMH